MFKYLQVYSARILKGKTPSIFFDLIQTTFTTIVVSTTTIYVMRLLAHGLGPEEFGAYCLSRRIITTLSSFVMLGLDMGITRYVAYYNYSKERQQQYIFVGILLIIASIFLFIGIGFSFEDTFSKWLFKNRQLKPLLHSTLLMTLGVALYTALYAIFRGYRQMNKANFLQIVNMLIGPLIIALSMAKRANSARIVMAMGFVYILSCSIPLAITFITSFKSAIKGLVNSISPVVELLMYGIPRIPATIAFAILFTIGPFWAQKIGALEEAGFFSVGQSIILMIGTFASGIGIVLLPKIAELLNSDRTEEIREYLYIICDFVLHISLFLTIQIYLFVDRIIIAWFGSQYAPAITIARFILLSLGPYLAYIMLRSVVDAVEVKAINTASLLFALGVTVIVSLIMGQFGLGVIGLAIGFTCGMATLGVSTFYFLHSKYSLTSHHYHFSLVFLINLSLSIVGFAIRSFIAKFPIPLAGIALCEIILFLFYCFILKFFGVSWVNKLTKRLCFR
jgi:O-antigen/teichoic acid export membrane protein